VTRLGALALAVLLAAATPGCGSDGTTAALTASAATGAASASATSAPLTAAPPGTAEAGGSAAATAAPPARATAADCEHLHDVSRDYGRAMVESAEKDPVRREALFGEMDKKLAEQKDEYMKKCTALAAAGVTCAADALEKKDSVALVSCPIDISVLEPE
jgi:hypothetical protein